MTNIQWERVDAGRYAAEYLGHVLQAIRKDGPFQPDDKPYVAIVNRVPVGDAWNLSIAKTKAIQHVQRQDGKAKARQLFSGSKAIPEPAPEPQEEPELEPVLLEPIFEPLPDQPDETPEIMSHLGSPGQLAITGSLKRGGDLLDTLNALRSALDLLRESADLDCTVNLPPVMKL